MSWISMDIETVGTPWDELPESLHRKVWERYLMGEPSEASPEAHLDALTDQGALSPMLGRILVIGFERSDGKRLCLLSEGMAATSGWTEKRHDVEYFYGDDEADMLRKAWSVLADGYPQVITFNGRGFDVPFLIARSLVHGIKPCRQLMGNRFRTDDHADVLEILTHFGAMRRFSFDEACYAFGVESPKGEGIDGSQVGAFYRAGKLAQIADYCMRDVRALAELWLKVRP